LFTHLGFVSFGAVTLAVDVNSAQARNLLLIFNETIDCWAANLSHSRGGEAGGLANWQFGVLLQ
jgi:hypothetical protein